MLDQYRASAPTAGAWGWAERARQALIAASAPLALLIALVTWCWWYLGGAPLRAAEAVSPGAASSLRLAGFHAAETAPDGRGFRWTSGPAELRLAAPGPGPYVLAIELAAPRPGGAPVPVTVSLNDAPIARLDQGPALRRHLLLVPAGAARWGENRLGIASPSFRPGGAERRALGVAVFAAGWQSTAAPWWLAPAQAAAIAGAAAALYGLARRAGIPVGVSLIAGALFVAILLSMRHSDPRFVARLNALALTCGLGLLAAAATPLVRPQPGDGPLPWRAWLGLHWPALAGYLALTALMLWPVVARSSSQIPGLPGDAYEYLWKLQHFADYLVRRHQSPAFVPELMYPEGLELANSELSPGNNLLALPLTWLCGPLVSYNAVSLSSYVLSGFGAYLLIHRLGARRLAAFVGAIAFAFTVRRFFQMQAGHLPHMPTQYLALAVYGLEGLLTRRRSWDAFVVAVSLALATWASLLLGSTLALFLAGYALVRLGARPALAWAAAAWRPIVLGAVVLAALVAPFAQPYLESRAAGLALRHGIIQLVVHAARPGDYLPPNPYHPLFGPWARQFHRQDGGEHVVTIGYSVMALIALGLWLGRPRRLVAALGALAAGAFVLSLGPFLQLPGGAMLPLPVLFIYEHVPVLDGIRVWNRVVLYLVLFGAALGGLALTALRGRGYYLGAGAAAALLLFELAAVAGFTTAGPRPVDLWLRSQPDRGAVIELPVHLSGADVYYASFQGRPSSVWYGTFAPPLYAEGEGALKSFPSPRAVRLLQRWGVAYVLVDEAGLSARAPGWEAAVAALPELTLRHAAGGYRVYALAGQATSSR